MKEEKNQEINLNEMPIIKVRCETYSSLKFKLNNLHSKRKLYCTLFTITAMIITAIIAYFISLSETDYIFKLYNIVVMVILAICAGIITFSFSIFYFDVQESFIRERMSGFESEYIQAELQEDIFENSIKMSYKYLNEYYSQTRDQARKGFYITVSVSVFGAFLVGLGILMMFLNKTEPSYVTCASGIITEFIAAIFFYLYNKTIISMSNYHNKLVLSHNVSIALKVAESLPDADKTNTKEGIISELLKDINSYLIKSDSEISKE